MECVVCRMNFTESTKLVVLYVEFIHLYSASLSTSLSGALPTTAFIHLSIHSFIQTITTIAPLQVHYYLEALPTQHGYCDGISWHSFYSVRTFTLWVKNLPKVPTWRIERESNPRPFGRKALTLPMRHTRPTLTLLPLSHHAPTTYTPQLTPMSTVMLGRPQGTHCKSGCGLTPWYLKHENYYYYYWFRSTNQFKHGRMPMQGVVFWAQNPNESFPVI